MSETVYTCDRCGIDERIVGCDMSQEASILDNDGWRRIAISTMPRAEQSPNTPLIGKVYGVRDLCRLCYIGLTAFIEMPANDPFDTPPTIFPDSQSSAT